MTEYDQDRPSTESIAAMGRDDGAATTTADQRPTVVHGDRTDASGSDYDQPPTQTAHDAPFDDGQSHAAPGTLTGDRGDQSDALGAAGGVAAADDGARPSMERPGAADVQLMPEDHAGRLREQWHQVQATFVDDPRGAVAQADTLVAEVMQTLAAGFAEHKRGLEASWQRGEQAGTEDLRVALQSYRAFFDRLLHS